MGKPFVGGDRGFMVTKTYNDVDISRNIVHARNRAAAALPGQTDREADRETERVTERQRLTEGLTD